MNASLREKAKMLIPREVDEFGARISGDNLFCLSGSEHFEGI